MTASFISPDGTTIAYENKGHGPPLIVVGGALSTRADWSKPGLSDLLGSDLTVINFDRRGRGESTDTLPYAPEREIEDIEALLEEFGGSGYVYGISSGAALALIAASRLGPKITKLALYDAVYDSSGEGKKKMAEYNEQLYNALSGGHRGTAVSLFMKLVGVPNDQLKGMQSSPVWPGLEAVAPTLAYDSAVLGNRGVPTDQAARIKAPTLVMFGELSPPFIKDTAQILQKAIPNSTLRMVKGQAHDVSSEVLAPILKAFFCSTG